LGEKRCGAESEGEAEGANEWKEGIHGTGETTG
jgi:hypothetical protein